MEVQAICQESNVKTDKAAMSMQTSLKQSRPSRVSVAEQSSSGGAGMFRLVSSSEPAVSPPQPHFHFGCRAADPFPRKRRCALRPAPDLQSPSDPVYGGTVREGFEETSPLLLKEI